MGQDEQVHTLNPWFDQIAFYHFFFYQRQNIRFIIFCTFLIFLAFLAVFVLIYDDRKLVLNMLCVVSVASNKTIIGGGSGARLDSLGLDIKDRQNIIIRNLKISKADPDAIAFRNSHHVWIDHCDLSSQKEENDANDGLLDFTYGSSYLTVSWCRWRILWMRRIIPFCIFDSDREGGTAYG